MPEATPRGRFVWNELMTTDPGAAAAFYSGVLGWRTQAWESDPSYTIWLAPGGPVGGLMALPEDARAAGAPPSWLAYVATPDVPGTVAEVRRLGGRVLKDVTDIPAVGRFAVLADPQGAVFAAFTPEGGPAGGEGPPGIGQFSWHELATTDHRAAFGFYQQLFGWERTGEHDMGPMGTYQLFGLGGTSLGGMYDKPKEMAAPPHWLCYASVEDAEGAVGRVRAGGGQVLHGPVEVPGGGRIAQCLDPQGAAFAVHAAPAAAAGEPAPGKAAPRKAAPRKAAPRKAAARKRAPAKAARKAAAKKAARRRSTARKAAPRRTRGARRGARKAPAKRAGAGRKRARRGGKRR